MWTSLAFAAGLLSFVPGESEAVKFSNVRFTYCQLGMERTDTRYLPGDILMVAYDIENLTIDKKSGKVKYSLNLEVVDAKDKRIYKRENPNIEEENTLLSFTQPGYATVVIGKDQPPGKYTLKLTVKDGITEKEATLKREFEMLKEGLGITRVESTPVASFVGTNFALKFTVVGFGKEKKAPKFEVEINILNDKGEPMMRKPKINRVPEDLSEDVKPEELAEVPFTFVVPLNRVGKYTVSVKLTDKTTKKDPIELKYRFTVLDVKKYESAK